MSKEKLFVEILFDVIIELTTTFENQLRKITQCKNQRHLLIMPRKNCKYRLFTKTYELQAWYLVQYSRKNIQRYKLQASAIRFIAFHIYTEMCDVGSSYRFCNILYNFS
jgi:hypothetical protein